MTMVVVYNDYDLSFAELLKKMDYLLSTTTLFRLLQ